MTTGVSTHIDLPVEELTSFCRRNHICKLSLFGSVLRDDFRAADSDVDTLRQMLDHRVRLGSFCKAGRTLPPPQTPGPTLVGSRATAHRRHRAMVMTDVVASRTAHTFCPDTVRVTNP